jgi:uncharacterized protein (TIGR03083 family)
MAEGGLPMATSDPWAVIHTERAALAADLDVLTDAQWATQTLCAEWTVRQMVGHLTATAKMTPRRFVTKLAGAGFRFHVMQDKNVEDEMGVSAEDTLARFRAHLEDRTAPPGPIEAMVGEAVVHSADIRYPLGIKRDYPQEALIRAAAFYKRSNLLIGTKKRIAGLELTASDVDWASGSGARVEGPMLSLLLAMTGRQAPLQDLSGDGVEILRSRG